MTPLTRDAVAHQSRSLTTLTSLQATRLAIVIDNLDDTGRFLLRTVLDSAVFPAGDVRGQEAFREFSRQVNRAAVNGNVDLEIQLDSRKTTPDRRRGWFSTRRQGPRSQQLTAHRLAVTQAAEELHRAVVRNDLRLSRILTHLGIPDITDDEINGAVLSPALPVEGTRPVTKCVRCGHGAPYCDRCDRTDPFLGGTIDGKGYCHTFTVGRPTCYEVASGPGGNWVDDVKTSMANDVRDFDRGIGLLHQIHANHRNVTGAGGDLTLLIDELVKSGHLDDATAERVHAKLRAEQ